MLRLSILFIFFQSLVFAKLPIALSDILASSASQDKAFYETFSFHQKKSEQVVLESFLKGENKVALIRADMLRKLHKKVSHGHSQAYKIIGKTTKRSILYFAGRFHTKPKSISVLKQHVFSIGELGDHASTYLKGLLNQTNLKYTLNTVSIGAFRSISKIDRQEIDAIFLFASKSYKNIIQKYLHPYPSNMKKFLQNQRDFVCTDTECYLPYYLIVSKNLGKHVMQNIYDKTKTILDIDSPLVANLGNYFMYTTNVKVPTPKQKIEEKSLYNISTDRNPILHRAPWMDLALGEAVRGKGSTEYQFPMLEQSYKYIRFSKGDKGITTAPNDSKFGSWCAAYICWTLGNSGFQIHKDGRMASQSFRYNKKVLYRKIPKPTFGAIVLYTKITNPMHGHIGYLFGLTSAGKYILLGGNQNNRLKFAAYPKRFGSYKLNGFYVPIDYKITAKDKLRKKDIYPSAKILNKRYGISNKSNSQKVR